MPPLVDRTSALFHALNRNKRSIAVDLRAEPGRELALRLAAASDVVVESFRPGVLERLGLGAAALRARNPRLVLCRISGWGQDGPYRERAGHDLDYIAAAGVLSLGRSSGEAPDIPGVQIGDLSAAQAAAIAILAALHERDRSGAGQEIDVSIFDTVLSWLSIHAATHFAEGFSAAGRGPLSGRHPCYRIYRCADARLAVAALEPRFWVRLVTLLGLPHLAGAGFADGDEAEAVAAEVEAVFLGRGAEEWMHRLGGEDVCVEPVADLASALAHPQAASRGAVLPAGTAGPLPQTGFPFRLERTPMAVRRPAPTLGQHTSEVMREIGYGEDDESALRASGVVR